MTALDLSAIDLLSAGISLFVTLTLTVMTCQLVPIRAKFGGLHASLVYSGACSVVSGVFWVLTLSAMASPVFAAVVGAGAGVALGAALLDFVDGEISDLQTGILIAAGLVGAPYLHPDATWIIAIGGGLLGLAVLLLGNLVSHIRSSRPGLGQGDYGLALAGGIWCGLGLVGHALLAATAVTAIIAMVLKAGPKSRIPFAPGLVFGFSGAAIWGHLV